jgi:sugar lactone lactonase YvrE
MRSLSLALVLPLALTLGCSGDDEPEDPDQIVVPGDDDDDDDDTVPTEDSSDTGTTVVETGDTAVELGEVDCAALPNAPLAMREVPGASGYHDVAFADDGTIIGSDSTNSHLVKADQYGTTTLFVPDMGWIQQMVWLPDGGLAVASETRGIVRVDPITGANTIINSNIRPYGLILGPDDLLYAADQNEVNRVDPATGQATLLIPNGSLLSGHPRVIAFSLDDTQLFIGTYQGSNGRIYSVDLDSNYDPITPPSVFVTGVGTGSYHDGLGVDVCGNLYIPDYSTSMLYKVHTATGQVQPYLAAGGGFFGSTYGHGLEWGVDHSGWNDHALYMPMPYNSNAVGEIELGVPAKGWGGTVLNLP